MNLELMALRWLLYELRCPIALRERSPRAAQVRELAASMEDRKDPEPTTAQKEAWVHTSPPLTFF